MKACLTILLSLFCTLLLAQSVNTKTTYEIYGRYLVGAEQSRLSYRSGFGAGGAMVLRPFRETRSLAIRAGVGYEKLSYEVPRNTYAPVSERTYTSVRLPVGIYYDPVDGRKISPVGGVSLGGFYEWERGTQYFICDLPPFISCSGELDYQHRSGGVMGGFEGGLRYGRLLLILQLEARHRINDDEVNWTTAVGLRVRL